MAITYDLIAGGSGVTSFQNIPAFVYSDLVLIIDFMNGNNNTLTPIIRFNNNSSAIYSYNVLSANSPSLNRSVVTTGSGILLGAANQVATYGSSIVMEIFNYTQPAPRIPFIMTGVYMSGTPRAETFIQGGAWAGTASLERIDIIAAGGTLNTVNASLYGIKSA
jgi:hypothetical protein